VYDTVVEVYGAITFLFATSKGSTTTWISVITTICIVLLVLRITKQSWILVSKKRRHWLMEREWADPPYRSIDSFIPFGGSGRSNAELYAGCEKMMQRVRTQENAQELVKRWPRNDYNRPKFAGGRHSRQEDHTSR
jgi:hypothetical protein